MGFLSPYAATEDVDLGDGFKATLKVYLSTDDATAAQKAMIKVLTKVVGTDSEPEVTTEFDQGAYLKEVAARALVSWNLTDENDLPLPVSSLEDKRASVSRLPFWAVKVMAAVVKDEKRSGKEAETFQSEPSGSDQEE